MRVARTLAAAEGRILTASQEAHAQRFTERIFHKHDLSLPVQIEVLEHEILGGHVPNITTYHVHPENWLKYLVSEDISLLAGSQGDSGDNFKSFWETFRLRNPQHKVFQVHDGDQLRKVAPLYIHGDEGRSQKKAPYLVVSMESPIGTVPRLKRQCQCSGYMQSRADLPQFGSSRDFLAESTVGICSAMYTNYRGHSYLSRHLLFGVRHAVYKENPHVLDKLFEAMVAGFTKLLRQGVEVPGHGRYFAGVIGCKGDMDWHVKGYRLIRSYAHVQDRREGMICHCCLAASGVESQYPFDEFSSRPAWAETMHVRRPWDDPPPILAGLPVHGDAPERAIVPDTLHVVKLGIARDLIGGILLVLIRKGFYDYEGSTKNLKDRLQRAHSSFTLYCSACKEHPALRGFTKKWLHIQSFMSAPWCNSKASDSMILLRWLDWFLRLNLKYPVVPGFSSLLLTMAQTVEAMRGIFRILHSHGLFLSRSCASRLYVEIMRTLRGYRKLGKLALDMRIRAFILKPKCHSLHHIAHSIQTALEQGDPLVLSPEAESCEPNEDFIGRISRLSRRVGARCMDLRVFQRYFLKKRALHNKRRAAQT